MTWFNPPDRLRDLEVSHATLDARVDAIADDVRAVLARLEDLKQSLDKAAVDRQASTAAISSRIDSLESTQRAVSSGVRWALSRVGPIVLSIAGGMAMSDSAKAVLAAIFAN